MKLIDPVKITRDKILRSNAPSDGWQEWVAAGPPDLTHVYSSAGVINDDALLLWGSVSTPPCVIKPSQFAATYATSGGDFRGTMNGKAPPPVSPDGAEVAFVTNGGSNVSVYNAATLALKRTNNPATGGGSFLRGTQSILFSPDGQRIVVALREDNPVYGMLLPVFMVVSASLSIERYMRGFLLPAGFEPGYTEDYPDGYLGYIGIGCMSFVSNTTIVYGLMSRDGNDLGRGLYELDISDDNATPQRVVDELGSLFEYTAVNRCSANGHIAVVKRDRYGTGYSSLEILNSSYGVIATPYTYGSGERITSVAWSHDGAQLVVTTNLTPRSRVLNASNNYTLIEQYPEPFIARTGNYLYQPGTQGYLAAYPQGTVLTGEGVPYSKGDTLTRNDRIYESQINNNTDVPEIGAQVEPRTWVYLGYVNEMRAFDGLVGAQAVSDETGIYEVTIRPQDVVTGLALLNVTGERVRVVITEPNEGVVYDTGEIDTVDSSNVGDWYDYFFGPYNEQTDFVFSLRDFSFTNLPAYYNAEITITVSSATRESAIGEIVVGNVITLGKLKWGARYGIIDFSIKERDAQGNYDVEEGEFSRSAAFDISAPSAFTASLLNTLERFRARAAVWIGSEIRSESIIYGFFGDFDVVTPDLKYTDATITVESLI